uniref:PIR Superfamily Protein n=1 Tax=Parastrongyloides trichosuri TaxID=131310 RepID=A0A0N4Z816_PARTI
MFRNCFIISLLLLLLTKEFYSLKCYNSVYHTLFPNETSFLKDCQSKVKNCFRISIKRSNVKDITYCDKYNYCENYKKAVISEEKDNFFQNYFKDVNIRKYFNKNRYDNKVVSEESKQKFNTWIGKYKSAQFKDLDVDCCNEDNCNYFLDKNKQTTIGPSKKGSNSTSINLSLKPEVNFLIICFYTLIFIILF